MIEKHTLLLVASLTSLTTTAFCLDSYWQQQANYQISVELDDKRNYLYGSVTIEYINNSPESLNYLYLHLWANAFSNRSTAFAKQRLDDGIRGFHFADETKRAFFDSLQWTVGGTHVDAGLTDNPDIIKLPLPKPLFSGQKISVATPFKLKIPKFVSRFGIQDGKYIITHWYPKIAVFDKQGWHPYQYLDQGELYSDFGSYHVEITLPVGYQVASSGRKRSNVTTGDKQVLVFEKNQIHDFVWIASKNFQVLEKEVLIKGRPVNVSIFFTEENRENWEESIFYAERILNYYTTEVGDCPHQELTVVEGRSGMEYPCLVIVNGYSGKFRVEQGMAHEIGHNWFFSAVANNQREHMWMDEGLTTHYEFRYINTYLPNTRIFGLNTDAFRNHFGEDLQSLFALKSFSWHESKEVLHKILATRNLDQPISTPSQNFTSFNYTFTGYLKTALALDNLRAYLGERTFSQAIRTYYTQWKFKHPQPDDFKQVFQETSGDSLNWFFNDLLTTDAKSNMKLKSMHSNKTLKFVTKGRLQMPVFVGEFKDSMLHSGQWVNSSHTKTIVSLRCDSCTSTVLDPWKTAIDLERLDNNQIIKSAQFRRHAPLHVKLFASLDVPGKRNIYALPVMGFNTTDQIMAGVAFYNSLLFEKKWKVQAMPMYGFGSGRMTGSLNTAYRMVAWSGFSFYAKARVVSYADFEKWQFTLRLNFRAKDTRNPVRHQSELSFNEISTYGDLVNIYPANYSIARWLYHIRKYNAIYSVEGSILNETDFKSFTKHSMSVQSSYQFLRNKYVKCRFFGGLMNTHSDIHPAFSLYLNGSRDYLFDETMLDRAQRAGEISAFQNQTDLQEGGFQGNSGIYSNSWLASANFQSDIPKIPLLFLFGDVGWAAGGQFGYTGGFGLSIIRNVVDVYIPLTNKERDLPQPWSNDWYRNVRFTLKLNKLNPFYLIEQRLN